MDSAMTMKEQGINTTFVNWRGFFAAPGLPADKLAAYQDAIAKMYFYRCGHDRSDAGGRY
jgi:putative tricarboxylic transport membrane protein